MRTPDNRPSLPPFSPIGIIHSPFTSIAGMPIQPGGARGIRGTIEVFEEYRTGLKDLDGFSRIILIYSFDRSNGYSLEVKPFLDDNTHGVFATRAPKRPNPLGLSIVRLNGSNGGTLSIEDVDILDGTPLLDIKPYVPEFDSYAGEKAGWLDAAGGRVTSFRSDERFR